MKRRLLNFALVVLLFSATLPLLAATALAQQSVTFRSTELSLAEFFGEIRSQTNNIVTFSDDDVDTSRRVHVATGSHTVQEALQSVLPGAGLSYRIEGDYVVVTQRQAPAQQAAVRVTGRVVNRAEQPLAGASIMIVGQQSGITSGVDGRFAITVPRLGTQLSFSFMGYESLQLTVQGIEALNVVMTQSVIELGAATTIATGYATVRGTSFTGTATTVTGEELRKISPGNILGALQLFDPSMRIAQNDAMGSDPNTLPEFYIRGRAGIPNVSELDVLQSKQSGVGLSQFELVGNPNLPVFILDGFEVGVEKVYDMDINRIATLTILKDAAATAIYGSRASNGVIVVETRAPGPGKLRVEYSGTFGVTAPDLSSYDMMNARQALDAEVAAGFFDVRPEDVTSSTTYAQVKIMRDAEYRAKYNQIAKGVDNYWMSQPLRTQFNHKHSLFVEGGVDELRFGLDMTLDKSNGVMKGSDRDRKGVGLALSYRIKGLTIKNHVQFERVTSQASPYGSFADYSRRHPYDDYRDANGEYQELLPMWGLNLSQAEANPLYEALMKSYNRTAYNNLTNNLNLNWRLGDHIYISGRLAVWNKQTNTDAFKDPRSALFSSIEDYFDRGSKTVSLRNDTGWDTNAFVAYNNVLADRHYITVNAGLNAKAEHSTFEMANYTGFTSGDRTSIADAYKINEKPTTSDNITRLMGLFGMANYSFDDIYLFDASFRMDGSSEFGSQKRWAPFWALGGGLNLHKYQFIADLGFVSHWKLKATHGQTGSLNVQPFASESTYGLLFDQWYPTGIGASLLSMGNNFLTWQKLRTWDIGTEIGLWNSRLYLTANWYNKTTRDLVSTIPMPASSGFVSYYDNMGKVRNRGIEFSVNYRAVQTNDFDLSLFVNGASNRNRIMEISQSLRDYNDRVEAWYSEYRNYAAGSSLYSMLNNLDMGLIYSQPLTQFKEGNSQTAIYGMKSLGINPANGKEVFVRRDGTITYDWSAAETQKIGDTEPAITGALRLQARWRDLTLYTSFIYSLGGDKYNQTLVDNVENVNLFKFNADRRVSEQRWQKPGDVTRFKSIADRYSVTRPTSRFVQKDNTLNFSSLSLAYDFSRPLRKWLDKAGMQTLRTTLTMNDVAVISSIKQERGLEYPFARTFTFTLNATF